VGERYYFQMGAVGGATPEEYLNGSRRVADYLRRYGSDRRRWDAPEPTVAMPEAVVIDAIFSVRSCMSPCPRV